MTKKMHTKPTEKSFKDKDRDDDNDANLKLAFLCLVTFKHPFVFSELFVTKCQLCQFSNGDFRNKLQHYNSYNNALFHAFI